MKRLLHVIIILAMVCSLSAPAFATTYTWTGGGGAGDTSMDTPANWGGAGHPTTPADTVVFATAVNNVATPSTNNVEQNANVTFNSANDFTVAVNGAHTFGIGDQSNPQGTDGITAQTPDANNRVYTINAPVLIYDSQTWTVSNNGANTTTLAATGAIGQALGALSLTKAGNGILALSGATANTYSGLTAVNAGELDLGKTAGIDAIAATLTINGGVVKLVNSDQINNASTVTVAGGSLNTNAKSDTVGTLNMSSGSIDGATGTITATTYGLTGGTVNALLGTGAITVNAGTVTLGSAGRLNAGSTLEIDGGQLTLAGAEAVSSYTQTAGTLGGAGNALTAATYSLRGGAVTGNLGLGTVTVTTGTTTLNGTEAGTTVNINSGTLALGGSNKLADGATVTVAGGSLNTGAGLTDTVTAFNMSSGSLLGTGTITAANYGLSGGTVTGNLGAGTVTVTTNTTTLNGTEAGATVNINSGTLALGGIDKLAHGATVTVAGGGILDMNGANTATVNAFNMSSGSLNGTTGTLTAATYGLTGGTVNAMLGAGAITVDTSTVTLGSAGRLNVASTVAVQGGKFMLGGAESAATVTLSNSGALSIGSNTFTLTGAYQQTNTSILNVSVSDLSTIGHISSGAAATVATSGVVNITVPANLYIPANTTYKIVDGISAGSNVNVPGTIGTFGDSRVTFSGSTSSGDLFATSSRSLTGFASLASNSNATTVGNVLDNVLSASSDMTTVLNTLEGLSNSQTATALNSMSPTNDGAVIQSSEAMLNNFTNNTESHLDNMRTTGGVTGVATGDDYLNGIDIWAQGLGDDAHQDPRGSSQGYNATSWGVSGGADKTL